jgi:hypothetical protein
MTGSFCPANPDLDREEIQAGAEAGERIRLDTFPEIEGVVESKELYTTRSVCNATRDLVVPGAGGETIGLG